MTQQHNDILEVVKQWLHLAERNLALAKQIMEDEDILTDSVCFNCQQSAEKYLKAFLTYHQIDFPKTHSMVTLIDLCASKDNSFNDLSDEADSLTDYAVEIRYPDDWYEPTLEEAKKAFAVAEMIKEFVLKKLPMK